MSNNQNTPNGRKPRTVSELFPDPYLKVHDLKGKPVNLTIKRCTVEPFYNRNERRHEWKAVLDFGRTKRMILNKTQCAAIVTITGTDKLSLWVAIPIMLTPATSASGKPTINISAQAQSDPPAESSADPITAGIAESDEEQDPIAENVEVVHQESPLTQDDFLDV